MRLPPIQTFRLSGKSSCRVMCGRKKLQRSMWKANFPNTAGHIRLEVRVCDAHHGQGQRIAGTAGHRLKEERKALVLPFDGGITYDNLLVSAPVPLRFTMCGTAGTSYEKISRTGGRSEWAAGASMLNFNST